MLDARLFLISACFAFSSATRLCMIWAYSFCRSISMAPHLDRNISCTHRSILARLCLTTLERNPVPLVLEALRSDETLDLWSFGVRLGTLFLRLHFTADDELANLCWIVLSACDKVLRLSQRPLKGDAGWRRGVEPRRREHSHRLPC